MSRRLMVNTRCPLCRDFVEEVPDGMLKKQPHYHNAEIVVTKRGLKQYIHTSCWNEMIAEQQNERRNNEERVLDKQKEERKNKELVSAQ